MGKLNQLGIHVRLPDGREATTVYNGLDGVGIKFGIHNPKMEDFEGTFGDLPFHDSPPKDFRWKAEAMLRDPKLSERLGMPCVCEESEVEIID